MASKSPSWEDVSDSNSYTTTTESSSDYQAEIRYSLQSLSAYNMGPNLRKPIVESDAGSDKSGSYAGFRPPGQGGVPLYSPSPSPNKVDQQRSLSAFTPKAPGNMGGPSGLQAQPSVPANLRLYESYKPSSQGSSAKVNPEPVTPVRGKSRTSSYNYNNNSTTSGSHSHAFHPTSNQALQASISTSLMNAASLEAMASMNPMREEKEHHPAYLSVRSHCLMGQERISALRKALAIRSDVGTEVRRLLDADMEQFGKMLSAIVQQADLLASTLDENAEEHQTLKKMLATQTLECERLTVTITNLYNSLQNLDSQMTEMRKNHIVETMKLQEQIKPSPFSGPNFITDKSYPENMSAMPAIEGGNGGKAARPSFGYPHSAAPLVSPNFMHQTPGFLSFPPPSQSQGQRAVSYAAPPRYGNHTSARKFSGFKSSGAARFNVEDTPTRPSSGFRDNNGGSSQALVPRVMTEEDNFISEWGDRFSKLWSAVAVYCRTYVTGENKNLHLFLQTNAPNVWQYLCDVLYPNNPTGAGSSHAQVLLGDVESRVYLVQRLVIQYFINQMWCAEGWTRFNAEIDEGLKQAEHRLKNLDQYHVAERQAALETQAQLIARILMDGRFQEFRQFKLNHHVDRVKMIVGPMISTSKMRSDSQFDLHSIVSQAMEVSAVMFESRRRFDFVWNDTCAKFTTEHHNSLDSSMPPLTLQVRQSRLKLVITPVVTTRDERNSGMPRRVLKSDVLVMN